MYRSFVNGLPENMNFVKLYFAIFQKKDTKN